MSPAAKQPKAKPTQKKRKTTAAQEVNILHRIIETISYNLDLDAILKEIISVVDSVANADEIFLYLLKDNNLIVRAAKNESREDLGSIKLTVGKGITGWVAQNKKSVHIIEKAYEDKRFYSFIGLKADQYEAFLSLPLIYHEKLIGVLNAQHRKKHELTKKEMRLLQTIAHATAGAIENVRLFTEAAELNKALEARKVIEKAKGKLMKQYSLSEQDAYEWLKKRAMDLRKTMREVAEAVLISIE